ncbi:hypothetical protein PAMA_013441 [Pampus argenteus]
MSSIAAAPVFPYEDIIKQDKLHYDVQRTGSDVIAVSGGIFNELSDGGWTRGVFSQFLGGFGSTTGSAASGRTTAGSGVMWQKIYMSEFGGQTWKPKLMDDAALKEEPAKVEDRSAGHWKKMYFRTIAGQELNKWRRELRDISPYTGLPRQTEWVLRPDWRSLILKLDMKTHHPHFIGKDRLIKLMFLLPGFIIGVWRGQNSVAFIMVSLHFHKLVEKSLLGSPVCPFSEPEDRPPVDTSDPEFGLHGYTLHFVLHNTSTEIMSGHFRQLFCRTVQIRDGLVELKAINRTNLSQHRSLSGNIKLPWKSEVLEGSVENCCIMTLTLLDEFQKPFWCVSSPIYVTMAKKPLSFDYSGEHYLMAFENSDGQKIHKVNRHKSTDDGWTLIIQGFDAIHRKMYCIGNNKLII